MGPLEWPHMAMENPYQLGRAGKMEEIQRETSKWLESNGRLKWWVGSSADMMEFDLPTSTGAGLPASRELSNSRGKRTE